MFFWIYRERSASVIDGDLGKYSYMTPWALYLPHRGDDYVFLKEHHYRNLCK